MTPIIGLSLLPSTPTLQSADGSSGGSGIRVATVAASFTLLATDAATQILTPTVALTITLPSSTTCPGRSFIIRSAAATNVTMTLVQSAADGGATIGFIAPGEEIWVGSTGAVATGFVRVQRDPTSANANVDVSDAALLLGSSAALSRNYQRITFTASRIVTLPLSDSTPGGWFLIENFSAAGINITVRPNAADIGPAVDTFVRAGEWRLYVCVPTIGYVTASQGVGDNVTVTANASIALDADSTSVQLMAPTAAQNAVVTNASLAVCAGREFWIVHNGVTPTALISIRNEVPLAAQVTLATLGIGDVARVVGGSAAVGVPTITIFRAQGVNVQTLTTGKTLVAGDLGVQLLDPDNVPRVITLPAPGGLTPELCVGKKFTIRNTGYNPAVVVNVSGDVLTVVDTVSGLVAVLGPGDELDVICSVAATGFQLTRLVRAQNTNNAVAGNITLLALGIGVTVLTANPSLAYPIQRVAPNAGNVNVKLPTYAAGVPINVALAQPITVVNVSTAADRTVTILGANGLAQGAVLLPGQQATFLFDETVAAPAGANGYRTISAPLSGAMRADQATFVGLTIPVVASFRWRSDATAASIVLLLPAITACPGAAICVFIDNSLKGANTCALADAAAAPLTPPVTVAATALRAVIVQNDGIAWTVVGNATGLA